MWSYYSFKKIVNAASEWISYYFDVLFPKVIIGFGRRLFLCCLSSNRFPLFRNMAHLEMDDLAKYIYTVNQN